MDPVSPRVTVTLSAADLERERPNLERGSVLAAGADLAIGAFCELDLGFPSGERLTIPARAVLAVGGATVLAFERADPEALARCLAGAPARAGGAGASPPARESLPPEAPSAGEDHDGVAAPLNVQERLRGLSLTEQLRVAREGTLAERVALERIYGKAVWETLLRNRNLTAPEIARLARMGTMPRPLLELIVGNPAWLQVPEVRRALLSNSRLSTDMTRKVLALLPREELRLVPQTTAYPAAVRMAAKAMVKG